jgi:hypothetical protein
MWEGSTNNDNDAGDWSFSIPRLLGWLLNHDARRAEEEGEGKVIEIEIPRTGSFVRYDMGCVSAGTL